MVLFGGADAVNSPRADATWEWTGSNWRQCLPATGPTARYAHAMVYDSARQCMVMFGGRDNANTLLDDTWEWDGTVWQHATPVLSPLARIHFGMAFDSVRHRTVLFGGWRTSQSSGDVRLGDTWEWNGGVWIQAATTGVPARQGHAMVYDEQAQRTLLFGGSFIGAQLNDLWSWDGVAWTQIPATNPPGIRHHHTMTFDPVLHATVVQGGCWTGGALRDDSWMWDGTNWSQLGGQHVSPPRLFAAMAYDESRGRQFLFGGRDGGVGVPSESVLGDAWETTAPASITIFGLGCPGSSGVPAMAPIPGSVPVIGQAFALRITNLPITGFFVAAVPFLGFDTASSGGAPLPRDLGPIGMPGCTQYVDPFQSSFLFTPTGTVDWPLSIPNVPAFAGIQVHFQAAIVDLPVNPLGLTATNAVTATLGW